MKVFMMAVLISFTSSVLAADYGYLKKEDQTYYKNDVMEGNNTRERIDSTVKEINKLHGEINSLQAEMKLLKQEVEELKKKK